MNRTTSSGLAILLLAMPIQAMAVLAKDSPLRISDCVPSDAASLERLKALREKVRAEFARRGGPASKSSGVREWNSAWVRADDWSFVVGDQGIVGLDSPSKNIAALIPSGWTGAKGGYDPVSEVEAARAAIVPWAPGLAAEAAFLYPGHWNVRVSSPTKLGEGRSPMARFYYESGSPELRISVWPLPTPKESPGWADAYIGQAARAGSFVVGSDTVSTSDRTCRVTYLERETWKDPETGKPSYQAEAVLGCVPAGAPVSADEDLLVVLKTAEYGNAGAPDHEAMRTYEVARRSFCTIMMPSGPTKR